ncbi:hypothetical protein [Nocardioides pantholopis]|uniref:hypothetical protein n=1 Tax=Nocardioides pantholopis TaxID=2483798 RepID=UPI000F096B19|nr:hypothetical protein [Nocardioides pantholopis]
MTDRAPVSAPSGRLAYDDLSSPRDLHADCEAVGRELRLERVRRAVRRPAPSIRFEDYPRDVPKREIRVSAAAQRLANALHLHLD